MKSGQITDVAFGGEEWVVQLKEGGGGGGGGEIKVGTQCI